MAKTVFCTATLMLCLAFSATYSAASQQADAVTKPSTADRSATPTPDKDGIYQVKGRVIAPKLVYSVEPAFTKKDRKIAKSGTTLVQLTVDTEGHVQNVHVLKSSLETIKSKNTKSAAILDQKALDAVNQYRFAPATLDGTPVPVILNVQVTVDFF